MVVLTPEKDFQTPLGMRNKMASSENTFGIHRILALEPTPLVGAKIDLEIKVGNTYIN